ncbi:MAG: ABC transporter permease [Streptosporangiaceae bacterium]|jgi:peptide/nickel transport system permease protein
MAAAAAPLIDDDLVPIARRPSSGARAARTPAFVAGAAIIGIVLLLALLAPVISRYSPVQQNLLVPLQGPSAAHWLGTDEFGRDIWSRLLYGGRTDLQVGVLAVLFPFGFGSLLGTLCGYLGGWLDAVVMRVVDVVLAFPFYVLIIALVFFVGEGTHGIYIAFALTDWVVYTRSTRSAALVAISQDWVAAAEGGGLSRPRVLLRHLLPNTISQAIVYAMSDIVLVILAVVTLGYLGLGIQPPAPDWGAMISDGQAFITVHPWMSIIPGIAIIITGVGLSLLGDGLADLQRPR